MTPEELREQGIVTPDFVLVTGDAYVDHPSFGAAVIGRVLAAAGYSMAILSQPNFRSAADFRRFGRPNLGFLVTAGNVDSMVAHYTAAKRIRTYDYYSPRGTAGLRPDRATIVYCNRVREAHGDVPIIVGGLEASLRRFAHYDYWDNKVRRSILVDSKADLLVYGMGERAILDIAKLLERGVPVKKIRGVRGTAYIAPIEDKLNFPLAATSDFDIVKSDKRAYAAAFLAQYNEQDHVSGKAVVEVYGNRQLVQNPPAVLLTRAELDAVYAHPYTRKPHPSYTDPIPAIEEVEFSVTHTRGCFGSCNFCALTFHQGRHVVSRSEDSVLDEVRALTKRNGFKGYINDIGGPTANFRHSACAKQATAGACRNRRCLTPHPCAKLEVDHSEYLSILRKARKIDGVKRVFVRSGIRYDYLMRDRDKTFFDELVAYHVSGQLKVAPEHVSSHVLATMSKPSIDVYERFAKKFAVSCQRAGLEQYLVPYLMSSHPGSRLEDALELTLFLRDNRLKPEQVQDFYPTPGTASTVMYYTGIDPFTGKPVHVPDYAERKMQRALLQYFKPENVELVRQALRKCGRQDLIGFGKECLVRPRKNIRPKP